MQANLDQILSLPENLELLARESRSLNVSPKRLLAEMGVDCGTVENEAISRGAEKSVRELVQEAIARIKIETAVERQHLDAEETAYDVARRLGIIGVIEGGPHDLSTNPEYLEGFGE